MYNFISKSVIFSLRTVISVTLVIPSENMILMMVKTGNDSEYLSKETVREMCKQSKTEVRLE